MPKKAGSWSGSDQQLGKHIEQQLLHEIDAGHHEDQQQQYLDIGHQFMLDLLGRGHADQHGFDGQQAAGLQRIALERHGQREDELDDQQPAGDEGIEVKAIGLISRNRRIAALYHWGALPRKFLAKACPKLIGIIVGLCVVVGICVYAVKTGSTRTSGCCPLSD